MKFCVSVQACMRQGASDHEQKPLNLFCYRGWMPHPGYSVYSSNLNGTPDTGLQCDTCTRLQIIPHLSRMIMVTTLDPAAT